MLDKKQLALGAKHVAGALWLTAIRAKAERS